uniref:Uncharacterized protein n=1 Tax=Sphaerodactylus townsendi TaxID=933632 RepID=A0ACB8EI02_9SAUR
MGLGDHDSMMGNHKYFSRVRRKYDIYVKRFSWNRWARCLEAAPAFGSTPAQRGGVEMTLVGFHQDFSSGMPQHSPVTYSMETHGNTRDSPEA